MLISLVNVTFNNIYAVSYLLSASVTSACHVAHSAVVVLSVCELSISREQSGARLLLAEC